MLLISHMISIKVMMTVIITQHFSEK